MSDIKIELLKHPTDEDWLFCKTCTLNTVGKTSTVLPKDEWMVKLAESEHSPLRELPYAFKLTIPYLCVNSSRQTPRRSQSLCAKSKK